MHKNILPNKVDIILRNINAILLNFWLFIFISIDAIWQQNNHRYIWAYLY